MSAISPTGPRAKGVRWDLSAIVTDVPEARSRLDAALADCDAFHERFAGRVAELEAAELGALLAELARIDNELSRVASYVGLRRSVDVNDDEARDLEAVVEQGLVRAGNALRFFELEWIGVDDARAAELAAAPEVAPDRHHLIAARRYKPHKLTEPEERVLAERSPAAVSAWQNLFEQTVANVKAPFSDGSSPERDHTVDELLAYVHDPRREVRIRALDTLYAALEPITPITSQVYDALVTDRLILDRLRNFDSPIAPRHLDNELEPAAVEAMMVAIEGRYDIAQRWFRRKAELLGVDRLVLADQYAPLGEGRSVEYEEARRVVQDAFERCSPRISTVTAAFYEDQRIDAEPRQGKRGGAFCSSVSQDSQPFVLLNYTDRMRDVMTLAHELGHGMHFAFSFERQTAISGHAPLALCEVPSTFAELLVFDRLMELETDPDSRAALVRGELESGFATVFRQTMMARYEQDAYALRAEGKALTADRLADFWLTRNREYYGDSIELPEGYRWGWSYIPHFISTRFYTYAYAFAHLASLVLYAEYRERGDEFVERYLEFLATGGSSSPGEQLGSFGIDLTDPKTWDRGLDEMERMLELALSL